jgi:hypothetical protein
MSPGASAWSLATLNAFATVYAVDGDIRRYFLVDYFYRFYVFLLSFVADFVGTAYGFAHVVRPTDELPDTPSVRTWNYPVDAVLPALYSYPVPSI